jgi:hypothetical protein
MIVKVRTREPYLYTRTTYGQMSASGNNRLEVELCGESGEK